MCSVLSFLTAHLLRTSSLRKHRMRLFVKAKPNAGKTFVKKNDESHFEVAVKEPPVRGLANQAIISALAGYFSVEKTRVRIISGYTSRQKVIEILESNSQ